MQKSLTLKEQSTNAVIKGTSLTVNSGHTLNIESLSFTENGNTIIDSSDTVNIKDPILHDNSANTLVKAHELNVNNSDFIRNSGTLSGSTTNIDSSNFRENTNTIVTSDIVNVKKYSNFTDNTGTGVGANHVSAGGTIKTTNINVEHSLFENNKTTYGGAIYASGTSKVINSTFTSPNALFGGAVYSKSTEVSNSTFTKNTGLKAAIVLIV